MTSTNGKSPGFLHPSRPLYRFTLLIFVAALSFGSYFAYDIVSSLAPTLVEELQTARGTVGAFFTFYHVAAVLFVLFGGCGTAPVCYNHS